MDNLEKRISDLEDSYSELSHKLSFALKQIDSFKDRFNNFSDWIDRYREGRRAFDNVCIEKMDTFEKQIDEIKSKTKKDKCTLCNGSGKIVITGNTILPASEYHNLFFICGECQGKGYL